MRVLVCGDRNWSDKKKIRARLSLCLVGTTIIHGAARGADSIAGEVARELGFEVCEFPAEWERFGRAAGPIRNRQMIEEGHLDYILAFHSDLSKSKGTKNMVEQAKKVGIPVEIIY